MLRSVYFLAGIVLGVALGRAASSEQVQQKQPSVKPQQQARSSAPKETSSAAPVNAKSETPDPPKKATAKADPAEPADDLTVIDGIGPAFAEDLQRIGIQHFSQLAEQDPDSLAEALNVRVTAERIRRDQWIEQAKALAKKG